MARPDDAPGDVAGEAQSREEQDERPDLARPDAPERTVRPFWKKRQYDERHDGEPHARSQPDVVDPLHQRVQPGFFEQEQRQQRDDAACDPDRSDAGHHARGEHDEGRGLGRAVDVMPAAGDVGGGYDRDGPGEKNRRRRGDARRPQPPGQAADGAEHRERADAGKAGRRALGVSRPLTLQADCGSAQRRDQETDDVRRVHQDAATGCARSMDRSGCGKEERS
jgi:hypothetical protein